MVIMRCYKLTAKEVKTFVNAYKRIHNIEWAEINFYKDKITIVTPTTYNITVEKILKFFLNPYIQEIIIKEIADEYYVYAFTAKVKKNG